MLDRLFLVVLVGSYLLGTQAAKGHSLSLCSIVLFPQAFSQEHLNEKQDKMGKNYIVIVLEDDDK